MYVCTYVYIYIRNNIDTTLVHWLKLRGSLHDDAGTIPSDLNDKSVHLHSSTFKMVKLRGGILYFSVLISIWYMLMLSNSLLIGMTYKYINIILASQSL